eukprot:TRINITY_DN16089_c0_g2_i1.p1 TRINITY_DN16089_c0_g2~~TRINITY_DN16089_c0_g2_i1.p1  ORF type:complete len:648 (+),score=131.85 TRINITY_DN16089_c0_g2_i1:60-1946(+)
MASWAASCSIPYNQVTRLYLALLLYYSQYGFALTTARQQQQEKVRLGAAHGKHTADVYYLTNMADRFAMYSHTQKRALRDFHAAEENRLARALYEATDEGDKTLLEDAATLNEESSIEAQGAYDDMLHFVTTLKHALGSQGFAASCAELSCGPRASCADGSGTAGAGAERESGVGAARCLCDEGYEGNGFVCNPPRNFSTRALLGVAADGQARRVADLSVVGLGSGTVVVAFRDLAQENRGYLLVGHRSKTGVRWNTPVPFSGESQAFGVQLADLGDAEGKSGAAAAGGNLAIAFRDQNLGGNAILLGARIGADGRVLLSSGRPFARNQAQQMALVPLAGSRVAVIYAEHAGAAGGVPAQAGAPGASYGSALLAHVAPSTDAPEILGKHRFVSGAVARLSAAQLSRSTFVVAYRHASATDAHGNGAQATLASRGAERRSNEASVVLAQVVGGKLFFDLHSVSLEPNQGQIWARSVAPVQENVFAYTYHSGTERLTKQAILRVDPVAHRLAIVQQPQVLAQGFSPFAGSLGSALPPSLANGADAALVRNSGVRLFTYYAKAEDPARLQARMCKATAEGLPAMCEEMPWIDFEASSVAGAPLGDGRVIFVFSDAAGQPHYQLVGLEEDFQ